MNRNEWCVYAIKYAVLYVALVCSALWTAVAVICPVVDIVVGQTAHTAWTHLVAVDASYHMIVSGEVWTPAEVMLSAGLATIAAFCLWRLKEPRGGLTDYDVHLFR
jgi:hypothetical protein